jgi:heptosyltransferase-2
MPRVPGRAPSRVLLRLPNWIGDIVMATPALRALRFHWPEAHVAVAGPAHAKPILEGGGLVDEFHHLPARRAAGVAGLWGASRRLSEGRYDAAVLFTNSFSSALVLALARVPRRVGFAGHLRSGLLDQALARGREAGYHHAPVPMVEEYFRLVGALGVPRGDPHYRLGVSDAQQAEATAWLEQVGVSDGSILMGIHPGSSFGPSKLWDGDHFAAVADGLAARYDAQVLVFCGPKEAHLARAIAAKARSRVFTAADHPLGLGGLKGVIRSLRLLVTTDTGPRHFGPAFDVPTVVVMGSTDPRFTNTNLGRSLVVRSGVSCSPCQKKVCPIDHRCMTRLLPEHVLAAIARLLGPGAALPHGARSSRMASLDDHV